MKYLLRGTVNNSLKTLLRMVCRIDVKQLDNIPLSGPLILVGNHINFMDAPILFAYLAPRPVTALAKVETWQNPLTAFLFDIWEAIPIRRGEADLAAFQAARKALAAGKLLIVAPEGTRSGNGVLGRGLPGAAVLALRCGAPLLPVVHNGIEHFWQNVRSLRTTCVNFTVGNPFRLDIGDEKPNRQISENISEEIMYQIAALLPERYRGVYGDLSRATQRYLVFDEGVCSNLEFVKDSMAMERRELVTGAIK